MTLRNHCIIVQVSILFYHWTKHGAQCSQKKQKTSNLGLAQPSNWDAYALIESARLKRGKLSRFSPATCGTALRTLKYALRKLVFFAKFREVPPESVRKIQRLSANTVDGDSREGRQGIPSTLLARSLEEGGIGVLPWAEHIAARHAMWALCLILQLA